MSRMTLLNKLFSGHKIKRHQLVWELKMNLQLKHSTHATAAEQVANSTCCCNNGDGYESFIVLLLFYWEQLLTFYIALRTFSSNDLFNRINQ